MSDYLTHIANAHYRLIRNGMGYYVGRMDHCLNYLEAHNLRDEMVIQEYWSGRTIPLEEAYLIREICLVFGVDGYHDPDEEEEGEYHDFSGWSDGIMQL